MFKPGDIVKRKPNHVDDSFWVIRVPDKFGKYVVWREEQLGEVFLEGYEALFDSTCFELCVSKSLKDYA